MFKNITKACYSHGRRGFGEQQPRPPPRKSQKTRMVPPSVLSSIGSCRNKFVDTDEKNSVAKSTSNKQSPSLGQFRNDFADGLSNERIHLKEIVLVAAH